MTDIGINVVRDGSHPPEWVLGFGAQHIRIVLTPEVDLSGYFALCAVHKIGLLPVIASESNPTEAQLFDYAEKYGRWITRIQYGNEPDHRSVSSWTMPPEELSDLGWRVKRAFRNAELVCAGMCSGDPTYLDGVDLRMADYVAVHPYLKDMTRGNDLPQVDALVREYYRFGLPVVVSEWGCWGPETPGAEQVYDVVRWAVETDEIVAYYHFCMSDTMVWPFGLLRDDNSWKPTAYAFRRAIYEHAPPPGPTGPAAWPDVGWIGDGLKRTLEGHELVPTSGEHDPTNPVVYARTPDGRTAMVTWNPETGEPSTWIKVA